MSRVTIRRDDAGNVTVMGDPPKDSDFYLFALGKVLNGTYSEISFVPISYGILQQENITHQSQ
jgi:hypothetical protein